MTRKKVALIFGGRSTEHEISILSAKNIYKAMDGDKYEIHLIGIDKDGVWSLADESAFEAPEGELPVFDSCSEKLVTICRGKSGPVLLGIGNSMMIPVLLDIAFPVLHGPYGEDGTIQGLFKMAGLPFVGADEMGSAIGMDKEVMKRLLIEAGIPSAAYIGIESEGEERPSWQEASSRLGEVLFIKPSRQGSSVGISRVITEEGYNAALKKAFKYDTKVLIEECITGREIECAVLGNQKPEASELGEIIPGDKHGFYSYEAKYLDEKGATLIAPAEMAPDVVKEIQHLAIRTYKVLCLAGMARVDFFLEENGRILVNEVNTIPGFTAISMYPRLWDLTGVSYSELVNRLLELAEQR